MPGLPSISETAARKLTRRHADHCSAREKRDRVPVQVRIDLSQRGRESFALMSDHFRSRTLRTRDGAVKMPTGNRQGTRMRRCSDRDLASRNFRYTAVMTSIPTTRRSGSRRATTIAHIAAQAGVSAPTVSKVINGRSDVSLETRQRVEAVIREHGYERSHRSVRSAPLLEVIFH